MKITSILFACGAVLASAFSFGTETVGKPVTLSIKPIVETTAQIMERARREPARLPRENKKTELEVDRENLPQRPGAPEVPRWPMIEALTPIEKPQIGARRFVPGPLFSSGVSFGGPTITESGSIPPDSTGDVSPSSVLIAANGRIRSYSRTGAVGSLNSSDSVFFTSVIAGSGVSDPRIIFDRLSNRWYVAIITTSLVSGNNRICLAVSNGEAITAATTWTYFSFAQNVGAGTNGFADYETLGVDANAVYIGWNKFTSGGSFLNCDLVVIRKSDLLAGTLTVTPFRNLIGTSGMFTPQPCTNDDPAATAGFVIGVDAATFGNLKCRRISNPGTTPSISSDFTIGVPATANPIDMPISTSATTTGSVDSLDDRLFYARIFRNAATGQRTLWTAHNIGVNASGVGTSPNRTGSRWYEITNLFTTSNPSLIQAGTVFDSAATGFRFCTIPSIAMNGQGNAFVGFSIGNTANSPGVGGAWRLAGDTLGTNTAPSLLVAGANFYNPTGFGEGATSKRWGDYSVTSVDSRDGQSIWTFQEYVAANNIWQVRAVKLLAPAPTVTSISPNSITQGVTANIVVTGTGIFDPGSTYPDRLAALISGAGLTVNSVTWNSATQATVNVTASISAPTGARTFTLQNPDQQTASATLTVNAATFPVSGTLTLNGYTTSTAALQFVYEIRDSVTNAVLQTNTVTGLGAGNSFNLTTTLTPGSYRLRIKGTTRFLARSQSITITSSGVSGLSYSLLNGDVNGDNSVGGTDFNLIRAAWGSVTGDPTFNANADLNGDGSVGGTDFNILRANWGQIGDD